MTISKKHPIKVAMIIQDYLPRLGGAEKQLSALIPLLKERNVEVHILTRRYPGLSRLETMSGALVHRLPTSRSKIISSLIFTVTAIPVIWGLRPDIIHAHGLLSPSTTSILVKRLLGTPVVSKSLRGGTLGDLTRLTNKTMGYHRFQLLQKYVDSFIAISCEIQDELLNGGVSPDNCVFIPNGVKLDEFHPIAGHRRKILRNELGLPRGMLVVYVGRLEAEKRVEDLIKIWPDIENRYSRTNLLILGTGSQEKRLKSIAKGNVIFKGRVNNVATYLQTSDLFILPSVAEGLSNALLEALATGLPVVVTATGGAIDIVRHKVSGWLIHEYNTQNLMEGIVTFLDNPNLRAKCALEGWRFVTENYSIASTANKLRELYDRILST